MRVDQNQLVSNFDKKSKRSDDTSGTSFMLDEGQEQASTPSSEGAFDASSAIKASANVSAALWNISDQSEPSGSTSSAEVSEEGTARIQAMLGGSSSSLLDQFLTLSQMTPAERIRTEYLKEHNMTEDGFSKLSDDEQSRINKEISEEIQKQMGSGVAA